MGRGAHRASPRTAPSWSEPSRRRHAPRSPSRSVATTAPATMAWPDERELASLAEGTFTARDLSRTRAWWCQMISRGS